MSLLWSRTPSRRGTVRACAGMRFAVPAELPSSISKAPMLPTANTAGWDRSPWTKSATWHWDIAFPPPRSTPASPSLVACQPIRSEPWNRRSASSPAEGRSRPPTTAGEITPACPLIPWTTARSGTRTSTTRPTRWRTGVRESCRSSSRRASKNEMKPNRPKDRAYSYVAIREQDECKHDWRNITQRAEGDSLCGGYRPRFYRLAHSAALSDSQIVVILQVEPELRRQAEILPQPNCGIRTDRPLSPHDVINSREPKRLRQGINT